MEGRCQQTRAMNVDNHGCRTQPEPVFADVQDDDEEEDES